jgi:hypothetical protein
MRTLQFTADSVVSYNCLFRDKNIYFAYISKHNFTYILFINKMIFFNKNLTKTKFSSSDERNSTSRSSTFVVERLIE